MRALAILLLAPATAFAQHDHGHHGHEAPPPAHSPAPSAAPGDYAADAIFGAETMRVARQGLYAETSTPGYSKFVVERLEAQLGSSEDGYVIDMNGWAGGDIDKFWWKVEVEGAFGEAVEGAELQALWSRAIGPFFDLQTGIRYDIRPKPDRPSLVLGVQGLAPYMWEVDVAAFVSSKGDVTARIEAEYDQRLTQHIVLQPRIEAEFAAQDIPEYGIGAGLSSMDAGLRLGYQFSPRFKPYVGIEWQKAFGETADFSRATGEDADRWRFLIGLSTWF